jgi:hypothetical protein
MVPWYESGTVSFLSRWSVICFASCLVHYLRISTFRRAARARFDNKCVDNRLSNERERGEKKRNRKKGTYIRTVRRVQPEMKQMSTLIIIQTD